MTSNIADVAKYMETTTYIKAPIRNRNQYTASPFVSKGVVKQWERWYAKNRKNLVWNDKTGMPELKMSKLAPIR